MTDDYMDPDELGAPLFMFTQKNWRSLHEGCEAEIAALQARLAEVEAVLMGLSHDTMPGWPPCWCTLYGRAGRHYSRCEAARAFLAGEEKP